MRSRTLLLLSAGLSWSWSDDTAPCWRLTEKGSACFFGSAGLVRNFTLDVLNLKEGDRRFQCDLVNPDNTNCANDVKCTGTLFKLRNSTADYHVTCSVASVCWAAKVVNVKSQINSILPLKTVPPCDAKDKQSFEMPPCISDMIHRSGRARGGTAITVKGANFTIACDMGHSDTPTDAGRIQRRRGDTEMPTETRAHKPECSYECEFVAESNEQSLSVPIDQSVSNDKQVVCYSPDWGSRFAARTTTFSLRDKLKDSRVSLAKGAEGLDFEFTAEACINMSRTEGISDWGISDFAAEKSVQCDLLQSADADIVQQIVINTSGLPNATEYSLQALNPGMACKTSGDNVLPLPNCKVNLTTASCELSREKKAWGYRFQTGLARLCVSLPDDKGRMQTPDDTGCMFDFGQGWGCVYQNRTNADGSFVLDIMGSSFDLTPTDDDQSSNYQLEFWSDKVNNSYFANCTKDTDDTDDYIHVLMTCTLSFDQIQKWKNESWGPVATLRLYNRTLQSEGEPHRSLVPFIGTHPNDEYWMFPPPSPSPPPPDDHSTELRNIVVLLACVLSVVFTVIAVRAVAVRMAKAKTTLHHRLLNDDAYGSEGIHTSMKGLMVTCNDVEIISCIAYGSFGTVFKGKWQGIKVAVKMIHVTRTTEELFVNEAMLVAKLRHPNIVHLLGVVLGPMPGTTLTHGLVTELMSCSLHDRIHDTEFELPVAKLAPMALDIGRGMAYLHSREPPVLHRDLKSANILVDSALRLKITDFGLSRQKVGHGTMTQCGTVRWVAPEVLSQNRYTESADVYSFGIVLWEMAVRQQPFDGMTDWQVAIHVVQNGFDYAAGKLPEGLTAVYASVMKCCLQFQANERPCFSDGVVDLLEAELRQVSGLDVSTSGGVDL